MPRRISAEELNKYSKEQLENYIYKTAKKANLDLRALERAGAAKGSAAYRYVKKLAFDDQIVSTNKKGQIYFKTRHDKDLSVQKLRSIAKELRLFKASKTHTPAGVVRAYSKAFKTYTDKRAQDIAGQREGTIYPSKAGVLKAKRQLEKQSDKNWFNTQWGRMSAKAYKEAKRMSETVATLFSEGYSARQVVRAMNKIGSDAFLNEYVEAMAKPKNAINDEYEDYNPFLDI